MQSYIQREIIEQSTQIAPVLSAIMLRCRLVRVSIALAICSVLLGLLSCDTGGMRISTEQQAIYQGELDLRYPAVGALVYGRGGEVFCTATLICARLVLTAAHCQVQRRDIYFRFDLPSVNGYRSHYYAVQSFIIHPDYREINEVVDQADIAVAVLSSGVKEIDPIAYNESALDSSWINKKILLMGYGAIQELPRVISPEAKRSTSVPIQTLLKDRMELFSPFSNVCIGDSGGPGLAAFGDRLKIIGIISSGADGCLGVSTLFRPDYFRSWLESQFAQYCSSCSTDADCGSCSRCLEGRCSTMTGKPSHSFCRPCRSSADCGGNTGDLCLPTPDGYRCSQACDLNTCCPDGYRCQWTSSGQNYCVAQNERCPDAACVNDGECGRGESCNSGICRHVAVDSWPLQCRKCVDDRDCGDGICLETEEGFICVQKCRGGVFCPVGYTCNNSSHGQYCWPNTGVCSCVDDNDCHAPLSCQQQICRRTAGGLDLELCDVQRPCASGYVCVDMPQSKRCVKQCQPTAGRAGNTCNATNRCDSGLRCYDLPEANQSMCLRPCSSNAHCIEGGNCDDGETCTCYSDAECRAGYRCNMRDFYNGYGACIQASEQISSCGQEGQCTLISPKQHVCLGGFGTRPTGRSCNDRELRCAKGLRCFALPARDAVCGEDCNTNPNCQHTGGRCHSSYKVCICAEDSQCATGYVCKKLTLEEGVCVAALSKSNRCIQDSDCSDDQICLNGTCQNCDQCSKNTPTPKKIDGESCENSAECRSGVCADQDQTTGRRCTATCATDRDCVVSALCIDGLCRVPDDQPDKPNACACTATQLPNAIGICWLWLLACYIWMYRRHKKYNLTPNIT